MKAFPRKRKPVFGGYPYVLFLVAILFSACTQTPSSINPEGQSLFDVLSEEQIETITLELDVEKVRSKEEGYQEAVLSWETPSGQLHAVPVKTKVRGKTRRNICDFPPLKVKVDSVRHIGTTTVDVGKFKLVTHCLDAAEGDQYLQKEYLAYQMYGQLTEMAYRVHLVKIRYVDRAEQYLPEIRYAFLLESKEDLLNRLDAEEVDDQLAVTQVNAWQYNLFAVYQCMIGNTDWNLSKRHNIKLLRSKKDGLLFPVPYDFDYSGLVNANYAKPHPQLPIQHVTERLFQWRGKDPQQLEPVLTYIQNHHDDMMQQVEQLPHLSKAERFIPKFYLENFLNHLDILLEDDVRLVDRYLLHDDPAS
jgi:hypothetical protein